MPTKDELVKTLRSARGPVDVLKRKAAKAGAPATEKKGGGGGGAAGGPHYTYVVSDDHGDFRLTYRLKGDTGTYHEEIYGDVFAGELSYAGKLTWSTEYGDFRGFVYNADDQYGQYCYFFGDEVIVDDLYLWTMAEGLYSAGDPSPFEIDYVMGATRS